jgi:hypothetical protein
MLFSTISKLVAAYFGGCRQASAFLRLLLRREVKRWLMLRCEMLTYYRQRAETCDKSDDLQNTPPGEGRRQGGASKKKKRRESDEEPAVPRYLWHTPVNVWRERREVNQVTCRECGAKCTLLCSRCSNIEKAYFMGSATPPLAGTA